MNLPRVGNFKMKSAIFWFTAARYARTKACIRIRINTHFAIAHLVDNLHFEHRQKRTPTLCAQAVSKGILVLFPSYTLMSRMIEQWKASGRWNALVGLKEVVVEPRSGKKVRNSEQARFVHR